MSDQLIIRVDEDYKDITLSYMDNVARQVDRIGQLLVKSKFKDILSETHQMIGAGSSFGFGFISEIARRMDSAAKEEAADTIKDSLQDLMNYLDNVQLEFVPEEEL